MNAGPNDRPKRQIGFRSASWGRVYWKLTLAGLLVAAGISVVWFVQEARSLASAITDSTCINIQGSIVESGGRIRFHRGDLLSLRADETVLAELDLNTRHWTLQGWRRRSVLRDEVRFAIVWHGNQPDSAEIPLWAGALETALKQDRVSLQAMLGRLTLLESLLQGNGGYRDTDWLELLMEAWITRRSDFLRVLGYWAGGVAAMYVLLRWVEPPAAGKCSHCGYSLSGLTTNTCPECGRDTAAKN